MSRLSIIVAMARNRVIGVGNRLPWHISGDLKYFKALTMGHHIVMGRKTFESIGRPLPGRTTVIVTRDPGCRVDGCKVVHSLKEAIDLVAGDEEAFVVGGASLYEQTLPLADRLYVTEIQADFEGDAHFPEFNRQQWRKVAREHHAGADGPGYDFVVYERK